MLLKEVGTNSTEEMHDPDAGQVYNIKGLSGVYWTLIVPAYSNKVIAVSGALSLLTLFITIV